MTAKQTHALISLSTVTSSLLGTSYGWMHPSGKSETNYKTCITTGIPSDSLRLHLNRALVDWVAEFPWALKLQCKTLRPEQNDWHCAEDIFNYTLLKEHFCKFIVKHLSPNSHHWFRQCLGTKLVLSHPKWCQAIAWTHDDIVHWSIDKFSSRNEKLYEINCNRSSNTLYVHYFLFKYNSL